MKSGQRLKINEARVKERKAERHEQMVVKSQVSLKPGWTQMNLILANKATINIGQ